MLPPDVAWLTVATPGRGCGNILGLLQADEETMATYNALAALPDGEPGPWGEAVEIAYDQRDVLLYAVGIGIRDLRFVYESHPDFAVFPTFPIRWGGAGAPLDTNLVPNSPGPLNIDAERYLEMVKPLPTSGSVFVRSRVVGIHPRGRGNGFVEFQSDVTDAHGEVYVKMVNGSFRRGVEQTRRHRALRRRRHHVLAESSAVPDRAPDADGHGARRRQPSAHLSAFG